MLSSIAAVGGTALLFGLVHGFLLALPLFVIIGLVLAWLRLRTRSVYPGMVSHAIFNSLAVLASLAG